MANTDMVTGAVQRFREAAIAKGDGLGGRADAKVHEQMRLVLEQIRATGAVGKNAIRGLLHDESPYVRSWIGAQLLSEGEEDALAVLERDAALPGLRGLACEMVLREYRGGRLKSPFGIPAAQPGAAADEGRR